MILRRLGMKECILVLDVCMYSVMLTHLRDESCVKSCVIVEVQLSQ